MNTPIVLDELDTLAVDLFPGLVVRKDLLRRMRSSFGVPAFVIEFLLGKYCSSADEDVIREGLEFVRQTLAEKYVKPDERSGSRALSSSTRLTRSSTRSAPRSSKHTTSTGRIWRT